MGALAYHNEEDQMEFDWDWDEADDVAQCTHEGTGRVRKFDSGRCPLLCEACYTIVGTWREDAVT